MSFRYLDICLDLFKYIKSKFFSYIIYASITFMYLCISWAVYYFLISENITLTAVWKTDCKRNHFGRRDKRKEKTPWWLELRWQHWWCWEASDGVCWWTGCETWKRRVSSFPPLCHFQSVLTVFQCNRELSDTYTHIWKLFPNILKVFGLNIFFKFIKKKKTA